MTTEEEFVLELILEEEREMQGEPLQDKQTVNEAEPDDELYYIQDTDVTLNNQTWYSPSGTDELMGIQSLPINVEGELDSFLVIANSKDFRVRVSIDETDIISESYSDLATMQNELRHVSAYEKSGQYVVLVTDYPFRERFDVGIRPTSTPLSIDKTRVEVLV